MTDKQRNYIQYLNARCRLSKLTIRADDENLLGNGWLATYQNITPEYANEVIDTLKKALGLPIEEKRRSKR